jgi:hypothetical protein
MPVLVPAVLMARRTLGKAPARSLTALAPQRGPAEATAARRPPEARRPAALRAYGPRGPLLAPAASTFARGRG